MDILDENERKLLTTLVQSENAMDLGEFTKQTGLITEDTYNALETLVALHIFKRDNSYHKSEIGNIVYTFDDSEMTQALYNRVAKEIGKED